MNVLRVLSSSSWTAGTFLPLDQDLKYHLPNTGRTVFLTSLLVEGAVGLLVKESRAEVTCTFLNQSI